MKRRKLQIGPKASAQPDINVTPLVDVVLVLLIIFMVVTPLVERELRVVTPPMEQTDSPPPDSKDTQLMLAVRKDGTYAVNDEVIPAAQLKDKLTAMLNARAEKVVFFTADDEANYELAVNALDDAKAAGAKTIGMLTEPLPDEAPAAPGAPAPAAPAPHK